MDVFEYVSVLTSLIIGLGIAHLLQGVATLIQHPTRYRPYWVHLVWVAFMFLQASSLWWAEFALASLQRWTLEVYMFLLIFCVIVYLLCALLFPKDLEDYSGFEDYFIARRGWFLSLLALYYVVDFVDTALKGGEYFARFGVEYPLASTMTVAACFVGIRTSNRRFHGGFAVALLSYTFVYMLRNYLSIG